MTQYEQVVEAIKALGGRGTVKQILDWLGDTEKLGWRTNSPYANVAGILSRHDEFENEGHEWMYNPSKETPVFHPSKEQLNDGVKHGLYLIRLDPSVEKLPVGIGSNDLLFKVGLVYKGDMKIRLGTYNRSLPLTVTHCEDEYEFWESIKEDKYREIEHKVYMALVESDEMDIRKYTGGMQREWLNAVGIGRTKDSISQLKRFVQDIVNDVFSEYGEKPKQTKRERQKNRTFSALGIAVGSELSFYANDTIHCNVIDNKNGVEYKGITYSISGLAMELMDIPSVNGFACFKYQGKKLTEI